MEVCGPQCIRHSVYIFCPVHVHKTGENGCQVNCRGVPDFTFPNPAVLKSLSDGTLVGRGARNVCVCGDLCMFIFY